MRHLKRLFLICLTGFSLSAQTKTLTIVCPYTGTLENRIVEYVGHVEFKLEDKAFMKGLFVQRTDPEKYLWNAFVYQSSDINYSTLWGGHFIFDYYLKSTPKSKCVIGLGGEYIRINLDADDNIFPFSDFKLTNNIFIPYIRTGYYHTFTFGITKFTLFPWIGMDTEKVWGEVHMASLMFPDGPRISNFDDTDYFGMAGLNLKVKFHHFIHLDGKYRVALNDKASFTSWSAMANLFFHRHIGFSYRFKYIEISKGSNLYHLYGLAILM